MSKPSSAIRITKLRKVESPADNFGLSKEQFSKYCADLKSGSDRFIEEVMAKQLPESMSYLKKKLNISHERSYDICIDTFLEFRKKIIDDKIKYGNLRYLFTRMCVNQFIDEYKHKSKINQSIDEFLKQKEEPSMPLELFFKKLDNTISKLNDDQKELLDEIYYSGKPMSSIAQDMGITYASARKKKERLIKKLKTLFFA